jgi:hypothetical protein
LVVESVDRPTVLVAVQANDAAAKTKSVGEIGIPEIIYISSIKFGATSRAITLHHEEMLSRLTKPSLLFVAIRATSEDVADHFGSLNASYSVYRIFVE